jgi:hypothetical protein
VERFDPGDGSWASRAPIPTPRGGIAAAVIGTGIYIFGGEGNAAAPSGVFAATERYDIERDAWSARAPMSVPRHGIGAAVVGDSILIAGGSEVEGFGVTAAHTAYWPPAADLSPFRRGDAAGDGGIDITDAIRILGVLFLAGEGLSCDDAADVNDDGKVDISDPIGLLGHLFLGDAPPPPPAGETGDPTPDLLGCGGLPSGT